MTKKRKSKKRVKRCPVCNNELYKIDGPCENFVTSYRCCDCSRIYQIYPGCKNVYIDEEKAESVKSELVTDTLD